MRRGRFGRRGPSDDASPADDDAAPDADEELESATPTDDPESDEVAGDADGDEVGTDDADADDEDDEDDEDYEDDEDDDTGQIGFELEDWGARERKMLDDQLGALRIPRAWEAGTLVVSAADSEVVDDVIDEIEERVALDLAPDAEPVVYEVGDWPPGLEERFIEALIAARVPHQSGFREVTVAVDDEERVDALVEEVTEAWEDEQPTDDELDGPDAQDVLSELFVSTDRLQHDASDRQATVRFDDAAGAATTMAVPFGFEAADWEALVEEVQALHDLLLDAKSTDEEVLEAARALRGRLRLLV